MYIGDNIEVKPTPTPPIIRKRMNWVKLAGKAVPMADIRNKTAAKSNDFFRPSELLKKAANTAPAMQPTKALDAAQPIAALLKSKCCLRLPMVPEITAVSYPKSSPPRVATNVMNKSLVGLDDFILVPLWFG